MKLVYRYSIRELAAGLRHAEQVVKNGPIDGEKEGRDQLDDEESVGRPSVATMR